MNGNDQAGLDSFPTLWYTHRMDRFFYTSAKSTRERDLLSAAATRLGYKTQSLPYRLTHAAPHPGDLLYGGVLWSETLAVQLGMTLHETPLDWLATAPWSITGREIVLTTAENVWEMEQEYPGDEHRYFYKPLDGKTPEPRVYRRGELPRSLDPATPLLRQGVLDISMEVRTFALNGDMRACSTYALHRRPYVSPVPISLDESSLRGLVKAVHEVGGSAPATVMDFALLQSGRWVLLEQNAPWCSALYACNPEAAFEVIRHSINQGDEFVRPAIELDFHDDLL